MHIKKLPLQMDVLELILREGKASTLTAHNHAVRDIVLIAFDYLD